MGWVDRHIALSLGIPFAASLAVIGVVSGPYLHLNPALAGEIFWFSIAVCLNCVVGIGAHLIKQKWPYKVVSGPVILVVIAICLLCVAAVWFFWPKPPPIKTPVENQPPSLGFRLQGSPASGATPNLPKKSIEKTLTAPRPKPRSAQTPTIAPPTSLPIHLIRSLVFDNFGPAFEQRPQGPLLHGASGRASNVGADMLYWHIENCSLFVLDKKILEGSGNSWAYLSPSQGTFINVKLPNAIEITPGTESVTIELTVKYDTVPATGIRTSYQKIKYHLNWVNGNGPLIEPSVISQVEN